MPGEATRLPVLTLGLREPAEFERAWSGTDRPAEWRGRQGDGRDLTIERGEDGDLLFTYGDLARFRLHPDEQSLDCSPRDTGLDWLRILLGKVIPSISVMRGYEALHAAAVESPQGVVGIMASSGSGKSTLAVELIGRGWPLFADDQLTLRRTNGQVRAHPGTPHMNLSANSPTTKSPETLGATLGIVAGERWLAARLTAKQPRPVRMLCLLERRADLTLGAHMLQPNPLLLLPYALGLSSDVRRQRSRFNVCADLSASASIIRLTASPDDRPAQLADVLERALEPSAAMTSGSGW